MTAERRQATPSCDRLDLPPDPSCYIALPEDFGRRFAVFVDTEEEFDWSRPPSRDAHSTRAAESLPRIQRRLAEAGVKPVYLVDHPIAADPRCVATLREFQDAGGCTIGTQLHPWVSPPFDEALTPANSFAGNLPRALEREKLAQLTERIEAAFGRRPTVYRAGRYGVGPNSAELLAELGYEADVSVRPLHDYRGESGPDFSAIEPRPYWAAGGRILEVPLTAAYTGRLCRLGRRLYPSLGKAARSLLARAGLLSRVSLTPEGMPIGEAKEAVDRLLDDGVRLFSISFHSPSLEPGHTPYVRNAEDLVRFHAWWDEMFGFLARRGVAPAAIEQIMDAARRGQGAGATAAARLIGGVGPVAQR